MMRFTLIVLAILPAFICSGQNKTIIHSTFEHNDGWTLFSNENAGTSVVDGKYMFSHKRDKGSWTVSKTASIVPGKDFLFEAAVSHHSGTESFGYGIFLYDSRVSKSRLSCYFIISANGSYKIYTYNSNTKKSEDIQPWTGIQEIIKGNNDILKIEYKKGNTYFYVNNKEVFTTDKIIYGNLIGLCIDNQQTILFDDVKVEQDGPAINLAPGSELPFILEDMGPAVNSKYDDLGPVITTDGKTLYIFRKKHPENTGENKSDDIWISTAKKDETWEVMKNTGPPLNNDGHNFVVSVTPDNNSLLLANTYNADGSSKGGGLSLSLRGNDGWNVPQEIKIDNYYNHNDHGNFCLSPDRNVLILCIERDDSYGERDLYYSFRKDEHSFSEPRNLGPVVNSYSGESSPFLAADNTTLYYASSGKRGYGALDVFVTRRLDDTWTNWSEPENLGPHLNTPSSEMYYTIPASGNFAYMVSYKNQGNGGDIFKVKVPDAVKPKPVVLIKGRVLNSKTGEPLESKITYYNLTNNTESGTALSSPTTGFYQIALPYGVNYGVSALKNGFYPLSENIDVTKLEKYTEVEKDLFLTPLEKGNSIRLNNIFFDFNKSNLLPESYNELDKLISILNENPGFVIEISGHTDNVGSDSYNLTLSQQRAEVVVKYLKEKGVKNSLTAAGYGKSKPVASNDNEEDRKLNRRVEFVIQ
jgi:outer membrane protein OmpA-like peptidoglycan-associated protein